MSAPKHDTMNGPMNGPMTARSYDLILLGGGLANALIAWRLATERPDLRLLVIEQDALGGNHTWSFHEHDLDAAQQRWLAPLVGARWPAYRVRFPAHERTLNSAYASVRSHDLARVVGAALGDALLPHTSASIVDASTVRLADGTELQARAILDGRGATPSAHLALGYQTFVGQEVRIARPHGLTLPVIMDASVMQAGGYRFVYVLPFDAHTLLIEDTHYVDDQSLPLERLRANIAAYADAQGWRIEAVLREERGALPIVLAGDFDAFWRDAGGQPRSGLRAGLFHPTTGYSLPHAVRLAERIAARYRRAGEGLRGGKSGREDVKEGMAGSMDDSLPDTAVLFDTIHAEAHRAWRAQGFFRLLNRMLFLAGDADQRWQVMQRFYRLPEPLIQRFYAGRLTSLDKLRIVSGKPPVPVGQAIDAARRIHPHQIRTHA
ncbi:lycopene beta-cyclase CrtY [Chitinasiproducens palmae]|uniref:lycopene beta-cyclase CrtY n=1 Tax=Chitinasiproducens palmae TaxID=1770053 RepID=UPI001F25D18C|nr:lycopene beta-cyclase CrtY [Chitinasiproducens palmae]